MGRSSYRAHSRDQAMEEKGQNVLPFNSFPMCNCQSRMENTNTISRRILFIKEHYYQNATRSCVDN